MRNSFIMKRLIILFGMVFLLLVKGYSQKADKPADIPVVIIIPDQLRKDAIGKYTPNIDQLAKDGVTFNRAYCAAPLCIPSRGALFTGKYPNDNGSLINGWNKRDEHYREVKSGTPNLYQTMSKYWDTWQIGKQHFKTQDKIDEDPKVNVNWITQQSYHKWLKRKGVSKPGGKSFTALVPELQGGKYTFIKRYTIPIYKVYKPGLKYFPDDYFGDKDVEVIKNYHSHKPLLLITTFLSPHPPYNIPKPYFSKYNKKDFSLPQDIGRWYKYQSPFQMYTLTGFIGSRYSRKDWAKIWPKYYGLVSLTDHEVGRIINALKEKGLYNKALIIFTTDHGEMLGSHALWMKNCMYESSAHIPLIIKFPHNFHPAIKQTNQLVSLVDIWPTLMNYLNIQITDPTDGVSLMPLISGGSIPRKKIFIQYDGNSGYGNNQRCVIDGDYKLIVDTFMNEIFLELYNVVLDPHETNNLAVEPEYKDKVLSMISEIENYMHRTHDLLKIPNNGERIYSNFINHYVNINPKLKQVQSAVY